MSVDTIDQGLATDIDTRLLGVWEQVFGAEVFVPELRDESVRHVLGTAMRLAYAIGYGDALAEDRDGRRAELHLAHGYRPI